MWYYELVPCVHLTVDPVCVQGDLALHVLRRPPGHHRVEDKLSTARRAADGAQHQDNG